MCDFLTTPVDGEQLHMALAKVEALKPAGSSKGKIIATVRSTGGCGATFLAVNTACELVSSCDQSVAIVDMDFCGGQVATYLDLMPSFTLGDLAESSKTLDPRMLERVLIRHSSGLAVIARPTALSQGKLLHTDQNHQLITAVISTLTDMYDYVILDGLNPCAQADLELLRLADNILLVMNLLVPSIRNAYRMLEDMTQRHGLGGGKLSAAATSAESLLEPILLIINRLGRESSYLRIQDVEKTLQHKIFAQVPDDWRTVSRSINAGDPLALYAPNSKIRTNLIDMAIRLTGSDPGSRSSSSATRALRKDLSGRSSKRNNQGLLGRVFHKATDRSRGSQKNSQRSLAGVAPSRSEEGTNQ
jgi:pilus assembly protein CpaE